MHVYLPIAELSEPAWLLIALGALTGILAGLFGIGGGFILTPMLIFLGIPPAIAVASSACQIVASSFSGFLHHWKARRVDTDIGNLLIIGGLLGAALGVFIFAALKRSGQADITITLMYVCLLGVIAVVVAREGLKLRRSPSDSVIAMGVDWPLLRHLPFRRRFTHSQVTHSSLLPIGLGVAVGLIVSLMGVGGGFILIPAMMYILRMPPSVIVGTSLYHIIFITAAVTLLHAVTTHSVDLVLATLLMTGSVVGAQWGARLSTRVSPAYGKLLLAALLFCVAAKLASGLFITPEETFSIMERS
jgi:uncharacterized membrane protein YfcA